jgi:hypothetical protein
MPPFGSSAATPTRRWVEARSFAFPGFPRDCRFVGYRTGSIGAPTGGVEISAKRCHSAWVNRNEKRLHQLSEYDDWWRLSPG